MKIHILSFLAAVLACSLASAANEGTPLILDVKLSGVIGDGVADDTAAIQALLDSRRALVYLPAPPKHYLISKPPSSTALPARSTCWSIAAPSNI